MSVAGTKNFDQPPHDSNRTHLVFSTSGLLLGSRAPLVLMLGIVGQSTWIVSNKYKHSFKRERALPRSFM